MNAPMLAEWLSSPGMEEKAASMPESFQPKTHHRALAAQLGIDLDREFEVFKDHHLAKGSRFKDWNRALNTWLRRAQQFSCSGPSDARFLGQAPQYPPCPLNECDGSGWWIDRQTRRRVNCKCGRAEACA
jgi:hypothetical protein